jgi:hypothetical protein
VPRTPQIEHLIDGCADSLAGLDARRARHEQLVVVGVLMPHRRDYAESDRTVVELPAGGRATHSAAAALAGMPCDLLGASLWTAGEQSDNFCRHPNVEVGVLSLAS